MKAIIVTTAALLLAGCTNGLAGPVTPSTGQQVVDRLDCKDVTWTEYDFDGELMDSEPYVVRTCTPTVAGIGPLSLREFRSPADLAADTADARMCVPVGTKVLACPDNLADLPAVRAALTAP